MCIAVPSRIIAVDEPAVPTIEQISLGVLYKSFRKSCSNTESYLLVCPHCQCPEPTISERFEMDILDREME